MNLAPVDDREHAEPVPTEIDAKLSTLRELGIYLVPVELNIDPIDGYPVNNGVHPNASGYTQIGASYYSWIKSWLEKNK